MAHLLPPHCRRRRRSWSALALRLSRRGRVAAAATDDPVLVENSTVTIRRSDYQRELERLPPEVRPGFSNSEKRINDLLRRMLIERTLAAQARAEKLETRPEHAARFAMEQERLYAQLKVAEIDVGRGRRTSTRSARSGKRVPARSTRSTGRSTRRPSR